MKEFAFSSRHVGFTCDGVVRVRACTALEFSLAGAERSACSDASARWSGGVLDLLRFRILARSPPRQRARVRSICSGMCIRKLLTRTPFPETVQISVHRMRETQAHRMGSSTKMYEHAILSLIHI